MEEEAPAVQAAAAGENSWPSEADESAFLAEQRGQGAAAPPPAAAAAENGIDAQPLPSLEELVQRIPAETRAALDDLFRAKFTGVRRVPKTALKS